MLLQPGADQEHACWQQCSQSVLEALDSHNCAGSDLHLLWASCRQLLFGQDLCHQHPESGPHQHLRVLPSDTLLCVDVLCHPCVVLDPQDDCWVSMLEPRLLLRQPQHVPCQHDDASIARRSIERDQGPSVRLEAGLHHLGSQLWRILQDAQLAQHHRDSIVLQQGSGWTSMLSLIMCRQGAAVHDPFMFCRAP